jgi:hypothetical protein
MPHPRWAMTSARDRAREKTEEHSRQKQPAREAPPLTGDDNEQQLALATRAALLRARPGLRAPRLLSRAFAAVPPIDNVGAAARVAALPANPDRRPAAPVLLLHREELTNDVAT